MYCSLAAQSTQSHWRHTCLEHPGFACRFCHDLASQAGGARGSCARDGLYIKKNIGAFAKQLHMRVYFAQCNMQVPIYVFFFLHTPSLSIELYRFDRVTTLAFVTITMLLAESKSSMPRKTWKVRAVPNDSSIKTPSPSFRFDAIGHML